MNARKRRGSHALQRGRGDPRAVPRQGSLTSALPQTQPDASVQAWEPTLSAPDPWKRRRPSRDARKAVRSSSRVNVCGWWHRQRPGERRESLSARAHARRGGDPSPPAPAHLAHGRDAADVHRVGTWAERHAESPIAREEDVVVAAGHALGVHGEEAMLLGPGAPQVWVKPGEAVGIAEEQRGACAGEHRPTEPCSAQCSPPSSSHAPRTTPPRAPFRATAIFLTRVTSGVRVASCSAECGSRGQDELPVQRQELREARAEVAHAPGTHCDQLTPPGHKGEPKLRPWRGSR